MQYQIETAKALARWRRTGMPTILVCLTVVIGTVDVCVGGSPPGALPQTDYQRQDSDPAWLAYAAQFHGHLGPWAAAGARLGAAGRMAVGAQGYFDLEVTAQGPFERPPRSCFLDGLQVSTGATWGKGNIHREIGPQIVVRVTNTRTRQSAEVRPTDALLGLLVSIKPKKLVKPSEEQLEKLARQIARMPAEKLLIVTLLKQ